MMSSFAPRVAPTLPTTPDAGKHVNYTLGMVLGVDDFVQEFAYLSGRDQWLARDLLGYGTVCGLRVTLEPTDPRGPRIVVDPGAALSPRGQVIRVITAQCAYLNEWLAAHDREVSSRVGSPPQIGLFVGLRYRTCPTDNVPIPGEPCRTEDESTAASRLADDYLLELAFNSPDQTEEGDLRAFVRWLGRVEVTAVGGATANLQSFLAAIRAAAQPSSTAGFMERLPTGLRINPQDACEFLRAAFRLWTTELRPYHLGAGADCAVRPPNEEAVMLAQVRIPLLREAPVWKVSDPTRVVVVEDQRPYVVNLRLLQEWAQCGWRGAAAPVASARTSPPTELGPMGAELMAEAAIDGGQPAPANSVAPATTFDQDPSAGTAESFSRGDHVHGTPPSPIPAHRAAADAHTLVGDVSGMTGATRVEGLQGVPVDTTPPIDNQALVFTGGRWRPSDLPAAPFAEASPTTPSTSVAEETAFGLASGPGGAAAYSRGDHRHGTPPDPIPAHRLAPDAHPLNGDVAGAIGDTTVVRLRRVAVADAAPTEDQVLQFTQGAWRPADLPVPPPRLTPAVTVAGDVSWGQTPSAGSADSFSRGDHTHGTPTDPIPAHRATPDAHVLAGDVTGPLASTTVERLVNVPVVRSTLEEGQVLTVRSGAWRADTPRPMAGPANAVQHPAGLGGYAIVAAGIVRGDRTSVHPTYNSLAAQPAGQPGELLLSFDGYSLPQADGGPRYVVKALPVFNAAMADRLAVSTSPTVAFDRFDSAGIVLWVGDGVRPLEMGRLAQVEVMVEISEYGQRLQ